MSLRPGYRIGLGLLLGVAAASPSRAADGFKKVRCDQPIVPALIGARSSGNEPVARIEARRKAIGLKDLGADQIDDGVGTITWQICGRTFVVLDVHDVARDAVELPPHSREAPAFSASSCEVGGKKVEGDFLGVFASAASGDAPMLPVKTAWRIDRKRSKLVLLETPAACATDGIHSMDKPN